MARIDKGRTVYLLHREEGLFRDLVPNPRGALVVTRRDPRKRTCWVRLPDEGVFLDGSSEIEVASAILVLRPWHDQIAEDAEAAER